GAAIGGIWKTTNGGQSYTPLGDDLPFLAVSSIVVNQNNPNTIYIAISDHVPYGPSGIGVYKSTNGGATWNPTSLSFNFNQNIRIYRMEADPKNANKIFVATSDGVYRTTNGFGSVSKVSTLSAYDVRVHPSNSNIVYAGGRFGQFYRSTNGGSSFSFVRDFGDGEVFLAVTPLNPSKVYARVGSTLHKSFNSGGSFTASSNFVDNLSNEVFIFSPTNENIILAGNFEIHRSNNGGSSWSTLTNWLGQGGKPLIHVDQRNIYVNPLQNDFVYFCNDGGIYRYRISSNRFDNLCDGLQITQFYDIAVSQTNANIIGGGSQDNGNVFRASNGVWDDYAPTGDGMNQEIDPTNSAYRYWAYQLGGMYRWQNGVNTPIAPPGLDGRGAWETPYKLDPNNASRIIAGYDRVYRSTNRGSSWSAISGVLNGGQNMEELAIAPSNSNRIYTSSGNRLFVKSTTSNNWTTRTLPGPWISDLEVSPTNANTVYVTVPGYINGSKVFRSTNAGASWTNISGSLPNVSTDAIETYRNQPNGLFVGTDAGVYYRDDNLSDWVEYGQIPHTRVDDIEIQYSAKKIRIGTHGRGVLEATINIQCPDDDNDDVCNNDDQCPNFNDNLIGRSCNDNNGATYNDAYTTNCECRGTAYSVRLKVNKSEVCSGETAQLQVTTTGLPNASYSWQWSSNGTSWNNASADPNAPTWNLSTGNLANTARWWRVQIASNGFTATSHPVKTTVISPPNINVANLTSCGGESVTLRATGYNASNGCFDLADFIGAVDKRGGLSRNGSGVSFNNIRYAGGEFGTNYWDMTVSNAAANHYVDYNFNIPSQDFSGFETIAISLSYGSNPNFQLYIKDAQQGYTLLGSGNEGTYNLPGDAARKNAVQQIKLRFRTSDLGGNGTSRRCHLSNIRLCGSDFRWSNGATSTSITVNPNATTNYTATASYGNCSDSDVGTVSVQANPNLGRVHKLNGGSWIFSPNVNACAGDDVLLDMNGAFSGWTMTFTRPDGRVFPGGTNGVANDQILIPNIGNGSVNEGQWRVNYTNPSGCSGSGSFNISVNTCSVPMVLTGTVSVNTANSGDWDQINFPTAFTDVPIVTAGPPAYAGSNESSFRIRNVTRTGFQIQIDEWDYLDGTHTTEQISYLAATPGSHDLDGVKLVAKAVSNVNHEWKSINYGTSVITPVVLATQVTNSGGACTTIRTRSVTSSSCQISLQEEQAADGIHANETVHYMVLSAGTGSLNGKALRVGKTTNSVTDNWYTINYGGTYQSPHFLANMQTFDGPDPAALRFRNKGNTSVQVFCEEEQSADAEKAHTTEVVGYVVIGQNSAAPVTNFWLEAECGLVGSSWTSLNDGSASGGQALTYTGASSTGSAPTAAAARVRFNVNISQAGSYEIYTRSVAPNSGSDSYWVRVNNGSWVRFNQVNAPNQNSSYQWDQVGQWNSGSNNVPQSFNLSAGNAVIDVAYRENGIKFDKLFVSLNQSPPSGSGTAASNCSGNPLVGSEEVLRSVAPSPEVKTEALLEAFPNPFQRELHSQFVPSEEERRIILLNVNGQIIREQVVLPGQERVSFDLGDPTFTPGVYLLRLLSKDQQLTRKVMKLQ
ncbi:MAG: T9SS type A sorting domain-containing protein, partial [Bacteroidota bacterium]